MQAVRLNFCVTSQSDPINFSTALMNQCYLLAQQTLLSVLPNVKQARDASSYGLKEPKVR